MLPEPDPTLARFFNPRGVVVVGASRNPARLGYGMAQNLVEGGYSGAIHFVNPKGGSLFGRPIHKTIASIPDPVDLAVILVPPRFVPESLAACGERGIRAAIVASGGFREVGPQGAKLEEECLAIARAHAMRLIGPNCIGLIDTHLPLDTTFLPPPAPAAGEIAFISHSGAICAAIIDWSRGQGFGFSRLVSLGNQADVTETDVLAAVAADAHTKVIALYLEAISDGRRFVDIARQITPHKPIVVLKAGRTQAGQKAAASHTGALAGQEAAFDAAMRRAGIQRAATAEQLFDWARALAWSPIPQYPIHNSSKTPLPRSIDSAFRNPQSAFHVAVLTNAGGPGVMAADALEANGLELADLTADTRAGLGDVLPPAASLDNPVDMLASASPEQYAESLRLLLADEGVDAVMVILPPPPMYTAGAVARAVIPLIQTAEKPVVVALMGHALVGEALAFLRAVKIPVYTFPEAAAAALAAVAKQVSISAFQHFSDQRLPTSGQRIPHSRLRTPHSGWLPQGVLSELLGAYGIRTPASRVVSSLPEAVDAAEAIGFPLAMKIAAPEKTHKSDAGGVILDIADEDEVIAAFAALEGLAPGTPQILVQQMIAGVQEVIIGATRDAQFGPLLMFGSGGVEVEGLSDVAFALAPLDEEEARRLLRETWAGRKLRGYRNIPAADETAVIKAMVRLGRLAADYPQLAEIEINPLIVLADGAFAVDARARVE